jgi:hypothetical protein
MMLSPAEIDEMRAAVARLAAMPWPADLKFTLGEGPLGIFYAKAPQRLRRRLRALLAHADDQERFLLAYERVVASAMTVLADLAEQLRDGPRALKTAPGSRQAAPSAANAPGPDL